MAMNKKEQAAFDDLKRQAIVNRALRWTDGDDNPDLPAPSGFNEYVNGWSIDHYKFTVYQSWSSSVVHGNGRVIDCNRPGSASQNGISQFSSKEKALIALRRSMERRFATSLADIDLEIIEIQEKAA